MAKTTAQAFDEFYERVRASTSTTQKVTERRATVARKLREALPPGNSVALHNDYLIGSFGKSTASAPFEDIDLLAVVNVDEELWRRTYRNDSADFLSRVRRDLAGVSTVNKIGARGQAVRFFYSDGLAVDVAPVVFTDTGAYWIPNGSGGWLATDPLKHKDFISQKNTELGGNLRRLVVLAKQWNRAHSTRLRSFHLEMIVASTFSQLGSNNRAALKSFFEWASISVMDPAGYSGDLSTYLTESNRQNVQQSFSTAYVQAQEALEYEAAGNHEAAIRKWGIILGKNFPTYAD